MSVLDITSSIEAAAVVVGGGVALGRWVRDHGKREAKIDALLHKVTPNGGASDDLGDIAKRLETKVDRIGSRLDQHLGHSDAVERELFGRVKRLERG